MGSSLKHKGMDSESQKKTIDGQDQVIIQIPTYIKDEKLRYKNTKQYQNYELLKITGYISLLNYTQHTFYGIKKSHC